MEAANDNPSQDKQYVGTPEEVGAELAIDALGPTIQAAMLQQAPGQVARMIAGMVGGLAGLIAENYGPAAAAEILTGTASNVLNNTAEFGGASGHVPH